MKFGFGHKTMKFGFWHKTMKFGFWCKMTDLVNVLFSKPIEVALVGQGEIREMTEEDFQKHVAALVTRRLEKPKRLAMLNAKFWAEILCQQYNFDRGTSRTRLSCLLVTVYDRH